MSSAALIIIYAFLLTIIGTRLSCRWQYAGRSPRMPQSEHYTALRSNLLQRPRLGFCLPPMPTAAAPWGVVMDWSMETGTATVVTLADGTAGILMSSGWGYFSGGDSHDALRRASLRAVDIADRIRCKARPATHCPLPQNGDVVFYFLTDMGIFTARGSQSDLSHQVHPLAELSQAIQDIIDKYQPLPMKPLSDLRHRFDEVARA